MKRAIGKVTKKRRQTWFLTVLMAVVSVVSPAAKAAEPEIQTPHACVMEVSTGEVLYEKKADEQLHPASVTKVMTILLIFEALDAGKVKLDE